MIKQGSNTTVPLSLILRNIREEDAQVAMLHISAYVLLKCIFYIYCIFFPPGWIDRVNSALSAMLYELKSNKQVLYVLPITSIISKLPLIPVGDNGTIPFNMQGEAADFDSVLSQ